LDFRPREALCFLLHDRFSLATSSWATFPRLGKLRLDSSVRAVVCTSSNHDLNSVAFVSPRNIVIDQDARRESMNACLIIKSRRYYGVSHAVNQSLSSPTHQCSEIEAELYTRHATVPLILLIAYNGCNGYYPRYHHASALSSTNPPDSSLLVGIPAVPNKARPTIVPLSPIANSTTPVDSPGSHISKGVLLLPYPVG